MDSPASVVLTGVATRGADSPRPVSSGRFVDEPSVHVDLGEVDALELQQAHVLLDAAIQREPDGPGPREHRVVLDRRLVLHVVRTDRRVALDDAQPGAVVVARPVEPRQVVESGHLDHQGVAVPAAVGPAHPEIDRRRHRAADGDRPVRVGELVGDDDAVGALDDLERERHVGGARHPRHVALRLRIADGGDVVVIDGQAVAGVLVPLGQRLRPVGYLAPHDHALAGRLRAPHAEQLGKRSRLGAVVFQVPVGGDERLPDPGQVGIGGAGQTRRPVQGTLSGSRQNRQPEDHDHRGDRHCHRDPPRPPAATDHPVTVGHRVRPPPRASGVVAPMLRPRRAGRNRTSTERTLAAARATVHRWERAGRHFGVTSSTAHGA